MEYQSITFKNIFMPENVLNLSTQFTDSLAGYRFPVSDVSLRTSKEWLLSSMLSLRSCYFVDSFSFLFFFFLIYLLMRDREREREAEIQAEGETGSMQEA